MKWTLQNCRPLFFFKVVQYSLICWQDLLKEYCLRSKFYNLLSCFFSPDGIPEQFDGNLNIGSDISDWIRREVTADEIEVNLENFILWNWKDLMKHLREAWSFSWILIRNSKKTFCSLFWFFVKRLWKNSWRSWVCRCWASWWQAETQLLQSSAVNGKFKFISKILFSFLFVLLNMITSGIMASTASATSTNFASTWTCQYSMFWAR